MKNRNGNIKDITAATNKFIVITLLITSIFMSIGYATINNISISLAGTANVDTDENVHITTATSAHSASTINSFSGTMLNSTVDLTNNNTETFTITIYNNTNDDYMFDQVLRDTEQSLFYDNQNITFSLSGLNRYDTLAHGQSKTFTVTFGYVNGFTPSSPSDRVLNSYINFKFKKGYTVIYNNITTQQNYPNTVLEGDTLTVTFTSDVPYDVKVTSGNTVLIENTNYTYVTDQNNSSNKVLTVNNVTNNITIDRYYQIIYNLDGGTNNANNPTKYLHGSSETLLDPTKTDYAFDGWFDNSGFNGNAITSTNGKTGTLTLYAKWVGNSGPQIIQNADGSTTTITTQIVNGNEVVTGYSIDTTGTANGYINSPSGGIDTGVLVFDGYDFEATLKATFTFSELTSSYAVLNMSANNNNDMHGIVLLLTRATSGMGTAYNESNSTIGNVNSSNPAIKFRYNKYENGAVVSSGSQDFYSSQGNTAYYSNRFGTKSTTFTLIFKIKKQNNVFSVEIQNSNGTTVAKPRNSTTITFASITNDVTFEIGHWKNVSGQENDCPMKIVSFDIVKTVD